jgi:Bacterial sugar transferase
VFSSQVKGIAQVAEPAHACVSQRSGTRYDRRCSKNRSVLNPKAINFCFQLLTLCFNNASTINSQRSTTLVILLMRIIDILLSGIALLFFAPVGIIIAIIQKFSGEGDVFYRQTRLGKDLKPFKIIKFATMLRMKCRSC